MPPPLNQEIDVKKLRDPDAGDLKNHVGLNAETVRNEKVHHTFEQKIRV